MSSSPMATELTASTPSGPRDGSHPQQGTADGRQDRVEMDMPHPRKADKPSTGEILEDYADHTTMHGVWRVGQSSYSLCRRIIWVVALCVGISTLMYVVIEQLRIYGEFRVETVLSVDDRASIEFPSVTVCNFNQFRKTPTLKSGKTGELLKDLFSVERLMKKVERDVEEANAPVDDELTERLIGLAHLLNKTVLRATWLNRAILLEDYFTMSLTEVGVCYTFNSKESRERHGQLMVHDAGTDSGLSLLMDIENSEYYFGEGTSAGIRVLIHDPNEVPMVGQYGFSVAPGTATSAAIRITEEIFAKNPYTDCVDPADTDFSNPLKHYDHYTQTGCKMEHIVNYVYGECACKQYYNPGSYSLEAVQELRSSCPPLCKTFTYDSKLSYASFPAQHVVDELITKYNYTEDGLRKNVLLLKIYFQDLAIHKIEHRPAYTGVSLFADIGGQMGLCIGASMLTVVELVELAVVIICRVLNPSSTRR